MKNDIKSKLLETFTLGYPINTMIPSCTKNGDFVKISKGFDVKFTFEISLFKFEISRNFFRPSSSAIYLNITR